jgi:hypothetical protein
MKEREIDPHSQTTPSAIVVQNEAFFAGDTVKKPLFRFVHLNRLNVDKIPVLPS